MRISTLLVFGRTIGRIFKAWGHIGESMIESKSEWTIGPPAEIV